jgi:hypothetical protein
VGLEAWARPLIWAGAAAAAHGGMFLTPRPTALGFADAVRRGLRSWPHQPVLPTVGDSPAAVAHSGRNSKRCRPQRQMYTFTKFCFDLLFFENHDKLNIKKFAHPKISVCHLFLAWTVQGPTFAVIIARTHIDAQQIISGSARLD